MFNNIRHYLMYRVGLAAALTQTTTAEQEAIARYAQHRHRLVEIGAFHGVNTLNIRRQMNSDAVLFAVDPYFRDRWGLRGYSWARLIAHREVNRSDRGRVVWIEDLGHNAPTRAEMKPFLPIDFLFIDGDHSYEGLQRDWSAWRENIDVNGIVLLHDTLNRGDCGSQKFTREVIRQDERFLLVDEVDSLTVLRRRTS